MTARRSGERGFSVIEALVAVAILGFALASLLGWRTSLLRQHERLQSVETDITAKRNALAVLTEVNPMAAPEGRLDISPGVALTWRATPLTPVRRSAAYPAGDGDHDVALYRMDVTLVRAGGAPIRFSIERVGWSEAGEP